MSEYRTAAYIFQRRAVGYWFRDIVAQVERLCEQEQKLQEHQLVVFLHDCFCNALSKSLKLRREESGARKITPKWKDYSRYVYLSGLLVHNRINPQSFFTFAVQQRQSRGIPPTIVNIGTESTIKHFQDYQRRNTYRVSTYIANKTYEEQLHNQLRNDIIGLVMYELRKPTIGLTPADTFILTSHSCTLVLFTQPSIISVDQIDPKFYEDLMFAPQFKNQMIEVWNNLLGTQQRYVESLHHELRDPHFNRKLGALSQLLTALRIPAC